MDQFPSLHTYSSMLHNMLLSHTYDRCSRVLPHLHESMCGARVQSCMTTRTININTCTNMDHFPSLNSSEMLWVHASVILTPIRCNGVYKILLTKILSGYNFAGTRTSGGYPTPVYSILLNIATKLELQKPTHGAKLELLEATLVTLESYKRRCTVQCKHGHK